MKNSLDTQVREIALSLMEGCDCPRSVGVAILLRYGEWDQLVSLRCDPSQYDNPDSYFRSVVATDFLRKYPDFELSVDPEVAAIEKWLAAERDCYIANERLGPLIDGGPFGGPYDPALSDFVSDVRKEIQFLIGDGPPATWEGRFGPGATVSDKSRMATIPDKMSSAPTLTPNALFHLIPWTGTEWAKASAALGRRVEVVRGNAYFSVPKDATIKRGCAKGPSINGFFQLGLGRVMRERLKDAGINLQTGQSVHKQVACSASKTGDFATIDLSSASDTVCYNLVKLLLPRRWFDALDSLREPFTLIEGKWVKLEKFSAMGNGFTFELETTIFAAICGAIGNTICASYGKEIFVYGDDIIVPNEISLDVISALKFFGFTPNLRKTFNTGHFRESCGGDYFSGVDVRPYSLDFTPKEPHELISLTNGIQRLRKRAANLPRGYSDNPLCFRRAWFRCMDFIPSTVRACRGPEELGDLVIHDDEQRWVTRWRANCIRYVRVYRPARYRKVWWERFAYVVQFATALYLAGRNPDRDFLTPDGGFIPRDGVNGYKVGWIPFS